MTGDFFLTTWFFLGMRWLCENVVGNSVFLTILISTLLLRLITLFSDIKQRKQSQKMGELQPKLEKLQERYKNDQQKLQQEQQKLMKESGVSMLGGCLPLILTMVFLFCFIAAFRFWSYEQNVKILNEMSENIACAMKADEAVSQDADKVECIEAFEAKLAEIEQIKDNDERRAARAELYTNVEPSTTFLQSKFLWINNIWQPDNGFSPTVIPANTFFGANYATTKKLIYFKENSQAKDELIALGIFYDERPTYSDVNESGEVTGVSDASKSGVTYKELTDAQKAGLKKTAVARYNALTARLTVVYEGHNNGWFILPILATLFQVLYVVYSQKSVSKTQAAQGGTGKFMLYVMPIMSFVFCLSYTAAFAMYWTLSSMAMLIINIILSKVIKTGAKA